MILEVENLSFQYNGRDTLKQISFSIQKGSVTAILGPNGVGKTTLLKCLNHIHSPGEGEVRIRGRNIRHLSPRQIARQVSYVAQKNDAARMTVFDAVLMGRMPHMGYRPRPGDLEKVDAVMTRLGLSAMRLKYLHRLSGGELQKVSIARALVQDTDLMLLDEPTASLDLKNQAHILALIRQIVKSHGLAVVVTMHDLNAALRYADHYIFLKDRTIYSAGHIHEITPEMVASVYGICVEIIYHQGHPIVVPLAGADEKAA